VVPPLTLLFEILVLKDIGSGSNQAEAHALFAGVTRRECIAAQHHNLVRRAMLAVMKNFIDSCFSNGFAGAEQEIGWARSS
jgi:hypothetical protein